MLRATAAVFYIYRYDTGIWGFIDSFRVVLVCGMRKWYTSFIDSARGKRWKCTAKGQPLEVQGLLQKCLRAEKALRSTTRGIHLGELCVKTAEAGADEPDRRRSMTVRLLASQGDVPWLASRRTVMT